MSRSTLRVIVAALLFGILGVALGQVPYTKVGGPVPAGTSTSTYNPVLTGVLDGAAAIQAAQGAGSITLLASASRNATTNSPAQLNYNNRGVLLFLNVTVASGTGGLQMQPQAQDPVSGTWVDTAGSTTAVTATGETTYWIYPVTFAGTSSSITTKAQAPLPANWRVVVIAGDSSSYTYSLAAQVMP